MVAGKLGTEVRGQQSIHLGGLGSNSPETSGNLSTRHNVNNTHSFAIENIGVYIVISKQFIFVLVFSFIGINLT